MSLILKSFFAEHSITFALRLGSSPDTQFLTYSKDTSRFDSGKSFLLPANTIGKSYFYIIYEINVEIFFFV